MKILVEAFSAPGCSKCAQTREALKSGAEGHIGIPGQVFGLYYGTESSPGLW